MNKQTPGSNIVRGLNDRVILGTLAVLGGLFLAGMFPRWRANATLTNAALDQRPPLGVISPQRPDANATLVLPGKIDIRSSKFLTALFDIPGPDSDAI